MNTTQTDPLKPTKRFGLIPARIGTDIQHTIGIGMPLEDPLYSTVTNVVGGRTRTTAIATKKNYAYAPRNGAQFPVEALPGATVYLNVQDITRIEPELVDQAKWVCKHHGCAGKRFASKAELVQSHGKNKDLIDEANRDPRGGDVEPAGNLAQGRRNPLAGGAHGSRLSTSARWDRPDPTRPECHLRDWPAC